MALNLKAGLKSGIQNVRNNVETLLKGKVAPAHLPEINQIAKKLSIPFEAARQMHAVDLASSLAKTSSNVAKAALQSIEPKTAYADYGGMKDLEYTRQATLDKGLPMTSNAWDQDRSAAIYDPKGHTTFVPASAADAKAGNSTYYGAKIFTTPSGYKYTVIGERSPSNPAVDARLAKTAMILPVYTNKLGENVSTSMTLPVGAPNNPDNYPISVINTRPFSAQARNIINKEVIRHFAAQPESKGINAFSFEGSTIDYGNNFDANGNPTDQEKYIEVN